MWRPLVSIITPTYNSSEYITDTYNSLKEQSIIDWEWLVTDDCSTDSTFEILESLSHKDSRIKVFRNVVNSGAAVTRNNSLKNAQGKFLAFIDSDDLWLPYKLERQISFMGNDIDFSFTQFVPVDAECNPIGKAVDNSGIEFVDYEHMLKKKATLGCSTVILRSSSFDKIVMPNIRTGQDYALWLKLLKQGKKAYLLSEVLTLYRVLPNSISRNKFKKALRQWKIYYRLERLSLIRSLICFSYYGYRAIFRK